MALLALSTCKEKDDKKKQKCCDVGSVNELSLLVRHKWVPINGDLLYPERIAILLKRFDLRHAFFGEIRPDPPCAFALLDPDDLP
jgi:hypothetical protein